MGLRRLIVVGGGAAGYTAALYAARAKLEPLVVEGVRWGGQLMQSSRVENYPGYREGVLGAEMISNSRDQAETFGAEYLTADADLIDLDGSPTVQVAGQAYRAEALIIATGSHPRRLGLESERQFEGRGVYYRALDQLSMLSAPRALIVGGGDAAVEEALLLAECVEEVIVVHRRRAFQATPVLLERAQCHPRIDWRLDKTVTRLDGGASLEAVQLSSGEELACTALFIAIGQEPNTALFAGQLELDPFGFIRTVPGSTATSRPGVFAAGDVADPVYRQAITAAASGCMATIDALRYLQRAEASLDGQASLAARALSPADGLGPIAGVEP